MVDQRPIESQVTPPTEPAAVCGIPRVYIVGAAKAGTSYMAWSLGQHPRIQLGRKKESNYFSFEQSYSQGLDWYTGLYAGAQEGDVLVDASTSYSRYPEYPNVAKRIHDHAPDAKLIYLMRDPVNRAYSHFVHRWSKELHFNEPFTVPFEEHIETDTMCLNSSDYRLQLEQFLAYYPSESILCLFTQDLKKSREALFQKICDFLGVPFDSAVLGGPGDGKANDSSEYLESRVRVAISNRIKSIPGMEAATKVLPSGIKERGLELLRRSNLGKSAADAFEPPKMLPGTRARLIERFRESNAWVSELTGADLSAWNK